MPATEDVLSASHATALDFGCQGSATEMHDELLMLVTKPHCRKSGSEDGPKPMWNAILNAEPNSADAFARSIRRKIVPTTF